jgi:hypothetical protein
MLCHRSIARHEARCLQNGRGNHNPLCFSCHNLGVGFCSNDPTKTPESSKRGCGPSIGRVVPAGNRPSIPSSSSACKVGFSVSSLAGAVVADNLPIVPFCGRSSAVDGSLVSWQNELAGRPEARGVVRPFGTADGLFYSSWCAPSLFRVTDRFASWFFPSGS